MPPPTGAPHSPSADHLLTTDAEADGGKKPRGGGGKKLGAGGGKNPAFVRLFSEEDDVRILEGLAAYKEVHGQEPRRSQLLAALNGRRLDKSEFTVTQIYEKVRRLRNKYGYLRSAGGVPDDGDEARKYELSRSIWGDEPLNVVKKEGANRATKASGNANANANVAPGTRVSRGVEELKDLYPCLALAVERITDDTSLRPMLKRAFQHISDEKALELEAKMKKQKVKEVQLEVDQTVLRNQVLDMLIKTMD